MFSDFRKGAKAQTYPTPPLFFCRFLQIFQICAKAQRREGAAKAPAKAPQRRGHKNASSGVKNNSKGFERLQKGFKMRSNCAVVKKCFLPKNASKMLQKCPHAIERDRTRSNAIERDRTRSSAIERDRTRSNAIEGAYFPHLAKAQRRKGAKVQQRCSKAAAKAPKGAASKGAKAQKRCKDAKVQRRKVTEVICRILHFLA